MATQRLRELRASGGRESEEVVSLAETMFEKGQVKGLGDELWRFLEQVAFAALDVGKLELAQMCIGRLEKRFPDSPRVQPLHGMYMEATGDWSAAKDFYEAELARPVDPKKTGANGEANIRIRKRLISLHLRHPGAAPGLSMPRGIELLVDHLDAVYSDPEAWLELAEAYAELGLYRQSLAALEDAILLQPQNSYYLLRYAETAYTLNDYILAYKTFLRVIEMTGEVSKQAKGGPGRRAAFGAKLCAQRLRDAPSAPARLDDVDDMLSDQLTELYSTEWVPFKGMRSATESSKRALAAWIASLE